MRCLQFTGEQTTPFLSATGEVLKSLPLLLNYWYNSAGCAGFGSCSTDGLPARWSAALPSAAQNSGFQNLKARFNNHPQRC